MKKIVRAFLVCALSIGILSGTQAVFAAEPEAECTHDYEVTNVEQKSGSATTTSTCKNCGDVTTSTEPATGVMQDESDTWRYYVNGELQENYTGFADNQDGTWYLENGEVAWGTGGSTPTTGTIIYGTVDGKSAWYLVCNAKVTYASTVAHNSNGWWYVNNGVVDFSYSGIRQNDYGWWRIVNGKVDFTCNSVEKNEYGWWKLKGGKVDFSYTGIAKNAHGWWRIVNGKVDFTCNTVEKNENGWWKLKDGKVDFSYTGIAQNRYGWWRIVKGKVDFTCNTVEKNEYGWWKLTGGKVDFPYNGFASNRYGTWYIKNGKVAWETCAVVLDGKIYQVTNGKVDTTDIATRISKTYKGIRAMAGIRSFSGFCGMFVNYTREYLGIDAYYVGGDGNQQFDNYKNLETTTGGYKVHAYSGEEYSLYTALMAITDNGEKDVFDVLIGFEKGSTSNAGRRWGHTIYIHAIVDGTVYYSESFNLTMNDQYYPEGSMITCSIEEFANYYKTDRYVLSELDGVIWFEK